jgi:hypothetical protein
METKEKAVDTLTGYTSAPPFDPEKYLGYLEDTELSREQRIEYLKVLWSIMTTFVELGFGVDSVQQVLPALEQQDQTAEGLGAEPLSNEG